jgi:raffinose/stachyose/melibiose transport system permease protein
MRKMKRYILQILIFIIVIVHIVPFYILITNAFKSKQDLSSQWSFPGYLYLENFKGVWENAHLGQAFLNTIIITSVSTFLVVLIGALTAYPLSRRKTKFNKFIYTFIVSALIIPPLTILVPLYKLYVGIGAINTYWGVILVLVTFHLSTTVFLYTGFMGTISKELDEAAMMDGCSPLGIFFRIILPLLKPVTATVIIINGVWIWNDYQFAIFLLQKPEVYNLTVALSQFFSQYDSNVKWVAAGALMASLPVTIAFLGLQKYFIQGMTAGAVKE